MSGKIILNGELVDGREIGVGPTDPGFAYGFGVFETIKFQKGAACYFDEHLARLKSAVEGAGLKIEIERKQLKSQAVELFRVNQKSDGMFKIIVWEGSSGAEIVMFLRESNSTSNPSPLRLRLSPAVVASQAFTSRNKTLNYMEVVRDLRLANADGFDECVYCNEFGFLTESSVSNLFLVKDGVIKTPRLDCGLLDGIVRSRLIEVSNQLGFVSEEGAYTVEELLDADEVFVTNSGVGVGVVCAFDNGEGCNTSYRTRIGKQLRAAYLERERSDLSAW